MSDTAPIEHPTWLTSGDFTAGGRTRTAVAGLVRGGGEVGTARPERDVARDRRPGRHAGRAHRPAQGRRCTRLRLLYQHREPEGAGTRRQPEGRAPVLLEVAEPPGAHPRARGARHAPRRPTPISPRGRRARRSAPGPASSRARSKAGSPSRRRSRSTAPNTRSAPCRARRTGRAIASCLSRSSSGTTGRSACTIGSSFAARALGAPWSKVRMYP